jgi:hypothetical protein
MVEKKQVKLAINTEATERWMRKLLRASHELERLRAERKRLLKPAKLPDEAVQPNDPMPTFAPNATVAKPKDDDLDIPKSLDRRLNALPNPRTKEKKAERRAVEKERLDAELTGKRRKMPPSGKAALSAINADLQKAYR